MKIISCISSLEINSIKNMNKRYGKCHMYVCRLLIWSGTSNTCLIFTSLVLTTRTLIWPFSCEQLILCLVATWMTRSYETKVSNRNSVSFHVSLLPHKQVQYLWSGAVYSRSSEPHFCHHCSNCVIRTQWEALNCIQFPLTFLCLLTLGPDEEWDSSGMRKKNPQTSTLLTSRWHFLCAMKNTTGSCEVDWLHLWSLF